MIYDFDDGSKAPEVLAMGEEYNTADFDHPPCGGVDFDFGHPEGVFIRSDLKFIDYHERGTHS